MAKVGLIAMAAKPYHDGHDKLVRLAASENDTVTVFVSLSDRDNIKGETMSQVWKELIEPTLPGNVTVSYGGSPVGNVYKVLGDADKAGSQDVFTVYSDPSDLKERFKTLDRYAGTLLVNDQIILRGIERSATTDVSGTQMRQWLKDGDKTSFVSKLPADLDGDKVWELLTNEGLLRSYVELVLDS